MRVHVGGGLDLRWEGKPAETIDDEIAIRSVALLGEDYPDLRPVFDVTAGQTVRAGDRLFTDRRRPGLIYTAPVAGKIRAISRGRRRSLDSIVIDIEGDEAVQF